MTRRQRDELFASGAEEHILCDEKRASTLLNKRSEGGVDISFGGRGDRVNRRDVIALLGGAAAAWPLAARAQQPEQMRRIGVLMLYPENNPEGQLRATALREGLQKLGWVIGRNVQIDFQWGLGDAGCRSLDRASADGQNVSIEYRWAEGQYDRLPGLAADLVSRQVVVILAAGGSDPARAAKAATATIPIAFVSAADPVKTGLVASLNRPGGNVTGVSLIGAALDAKRLELLHELVPKASTVAALINPNYPEAKSQSQVVQEAAAHLGVKPIMLTASIRGGTEGAGTAA
jgi:putative ABC transport system substrate-binding protein